MNLKDFVFKAHIPLATQIAARLREAIVCLELPPGASLSETDIAIRFGVSRQPVREAFIKIADMGLLAIRPQRGTLVRPISVAQVMEARFVREAVEIAVAREAASAPRPGLVAALGELIERQAACIPTQDSENFLKLDEAFHRLLATEIGRTMAWTVVEDLKAQMDRVRFLSFERATPLGQLVAQHRAIVDAIAAGDADGAHRAMQLHLREILSSLPLLAQAHPDYFADGDASAETAA